MSLQFDPWWYFKACLIAVIVIPLLIYVVLPRIGRLLGRQIARRWERFERSLKPEHGPIQVPSQYRKIGFRVFERRPAEDTECL